MFKNLIFVFAATASAYSYYNLDFECPEGKQLNMSAGGVAGPSADKCCLTPVFSASCEEGATEGAGAIECPSGYQLKAWISTYSAPFNAETCCEIITCDSKFVCAAGTVQNMSASSQNASQTACCQTFVPDCFHVTAEAVITVRGAAYHLFECAEGTTNNVMTGTNTTVDQATCCQEFNATCSFHTGSLVAQVGYPCPAGKIANAAAASLQSPSEATCCSAYNASCSVINDARDVFPCAAGTVFNETAADLAPDQATCCMSPTCAAVAQVTCASLKESKNEDQVCGPLDMYDDAKDTFAVSTMAETGKCCKARPESTQFSRALEQHAGVGATASAAVALIMAGLHGL